MEKTDVGTDMRAPCEEEGGIIAQGRHDVNWIFPMCEVVMSKLGRETRVRLSLYHGKAVRVISRIGVPWKGLAPEMLPSPLRENRDVHKGEIGCLTGGSWELYMSQ